MRAVAHRSCRLSLRRRSRHSSCPPPADGAARRPGQRAGRRRMVLLRAEACRTRRSSLRRGSGHSPCPPPADGAARWPEQWPAARRMASLEAEARRTRRLPLRRRSRHSPCPPTAHLPAHLPGQRRTRPASLFTTAANRRRGATFPRRSGAAFGYGTVGVAVIAIRSPDAAATRPICSRSTTCCRSPRAVARIRPICVYRALLITECATATDRLRRRSPRRSAFSALLPPFDCADRQPVGGRAGHTSQHREPTCFFASASLSVGWTVSECWCLLVATMSDAVKDERVLGFHPLGWGAGTAGTQRGADRAFNELGHFTWPVITHCSFGNTQCAERSGSPREVSTFVRRVCGQEAGRMQSARPDQSHRHRFQCR